jgi:hypothetical protein
MDGNKTGKSTEGVVVEQEGLLLRGCRTVEQTEWRLPNRRRLLRAEGLLQKTAKI